VSILQTGRIKGVMDVSIIEEMMTQDVLITEIALLGRWARHPTIAVIARILLR
jgi:hypothetical protein